MKKQSNQKWLLPTLLIAALGSQYYFSVSSKNMSVVEMASTGNEKLNQEVDELLTIILTEQTTNKDNSSKIAVEKNPILKKWLSEKPMTKVEIKDNTLLEKFLNKPSTTEAEANMTQATALPCDNCDAENKAIVAAARKKLLELLTPKVTTAQADDTTKKEKEKDDEEKVNCKEKETRSLRNRCEKEQKRIAERDAQEERDDKFTEKYDELVESCDSDVDNESDLKCYADSFSDALKSIKGRGKGKNKGVSESVVRKVYNKNVRSKLKQGLADPENEDALEALETLMSDIPAGYKSIKTDVIREARDASAQVAILAQNDFKLAQEYRRTGRNAEAAELFSNAIEHKTSLINMVGKHKDAIQVGTYASEDRETWRKYETGYAKEAIQWVNNIMGNSNNSTSDPFGTNSAQGNLIRGAHPSGAGSQRGQPITPSNFNQNNVFGNNPQGTQINQQPGLSGSRTRSGATIFNPF